jgi:hypothetical protein
VISCSSSCVRMCGYWVLGMTAKMEVFRTSKERKCTGLYEPGEMCAPEYVPSDVCAESGSSSAMWERCRNVGCRSLVQRAKRPLVSFQLRDPHYFRVTAIPWLSLRSYSRTHYYKIRRIQSSAPVTCEEGQLHAGIDDAPLFCAQYSDNSPRYMTMVSATVFILSRRRRLEEATTVRKQGK